MSDARWKNHLQALAAIAAALIAGMAVAAEGAGASKPTSKLGEPSLARPSYAKEITPPGAPVGTDVRVATEVKGASESKSVQDKRWKEAAKPAAAKFSLRAARIDEADEQPVETAVPKITRQAEAAVEFAGGRLSKPRRLVVQSATEAPETFESSRRTSRAAYNETTIAREVALPNRSANESVSLVAAYRAAKERGMLSTQRPIVAQELPVNEPRVAQERNLLSTPEPIVVEASPVNVPEYDEAPETLSPVDAGDEEVSIAAEEVDEIEDTEEVEDTEEEYLAPIIAAADLPRPGSVRTSPEIRLPSALPKTPLIPSMRVTKRETEAPQIAVTTEIVKRKAFEKPEPVTIAMPEAVTAAKPEEPATVAPEQPVTVAKPEPKVAASKVPGRFTDSMQHAKALLPNFGGLKRAFGAPKGVSAAAAD